MAPAARGGGRVLFTDPVTVTGLLRREEMIVRSDGMGEFVIPPGLDERLIGEAGFDDVRVEDVSHNPARVAAAWHAARQPAPRNSTRLRAPSRTPARSASWRQSRRLPANAVSPASPT